MKSILMSVTYRTRNHHDLTFKESKAFKRLKVFIQLASNLPFYKCALIKRLGLRKGQAQMELKWGKGREYSLIIIKVI